MKPEVQKWLYDIARAISEIDSYFIHNKKDFNEFSGNGMLKRAIERNLEIIGEAVNRISKTEPSISISNSRKIIGLRNQIIHAYDNVNDEIVWGVIIKNLPELKSEIELLLKDYI